MRFTKISDERHAVAVARDDGSSDRIELGIRAGLWGSVAAGGALDGEGLAGADMAMADVCGHWEATSYGSDMVIEWLPRGDSGDDTASG